MSHYKNKFQDTVKRYTSKQLDITTEQMTDYMLMLVMESAIDKLMKDKKDLLPTEMACLIAALYELNERNNAALHSA